MQHFFSFLLSPARRTRSLPPRHLLLVYLLEGIRTPGDVPILFSSPSLSRSPSLSCSLPGDRPGTLTLAHSVSAVPLKSPTTYTSPSSESMSSNSASSSSSSWWLSRLLGWSEERKRLRRPERRPPCSPPSPTVPDQGAACRSSASTSSASASSHACWSGRSRRNRPHLPRLRPPAAAVDPYCSGLPSLLRPDGRHHGELLVL